MIFRDGEVCAFSFSSHMFFYIDYIESCSDNSCKCDHEKLIHFDINDGKFKNFPYKFLCMSSDEFFVKSLDGLYFLIDENLKSTWISEMHYKIRIFCAFQFIHYPQSYMPSSIDWQLKDNLYFEICDKIGCIHNYENSKTIKRYDKISNIINNNVISGRRNDRIIKVILYQKKIYIITFANIYLLY